MKFLLFLLFGCGKSDEEIMRQAIKEAEQQCRERNLTKEKDILVRRVSKKLLENLEKRLTEDKEKNEFSESDLERVEEKVAEITEDCASRTKFDFPELDTQIPEKTEVIRKEINKRREFVLANYVKDWSFDASSIDLDSLLGDMMTTKEYAEEVKKQEVWWALQPKGTKDCYNKVKGHVLEQKDYSVPGYWENDQFEREKIKNELFPKRNEIRSKFLNKDVICKFRAYFDRDSYNFTSKQFSLTLTPGELGGGCSGSLHWPIGKTSVQVKSGENGYWENVSSKKIKVTVTDPDEAKKLDKEKFDVSIIYHVTSVSRRTKCIRNCFSLFGITQCQQENPYGNDGFVTAKTKYIQVSHEDKVLYTYGDIVSNKIKSGTLSLTCTDDCKDNTGIATLNLVGKSGNKLIKGTWKYEGDEFDDSFRIKFDDDTKLKWSIDFNKPTSEFYLKTSINNVPNAQGKDLILYPTGSSIDETKVKKAVDVDRSSKFANSAFKQIFKD